VRRLLALAIWVVAMLGLDLRFGLISKAEEAGAVPYVQPDWLMRELQLLTEQNHGRYALPEFTPHALREFTPRPGYQSNLPRTPHGTRRGPPVGDFWTTDELRRLFP
jgi:hypothetical protein